MKVGDVISFSVESPARGECGQFEGQVVGFDGYGDAFVDVGGPLGRAFVGVFKDRDGAFVTGYRAHERRGMASLYFPRPRVTRPPQ